MLDANLTAQLRSYLQNISTPIELVSSLDDGPKSAELAALLDEIAALSDMITVRRADDDLRRPSFAIARIGSDVHVRFAGIPLGHEFTSLVLALLQVGGHPSKTAESLLEQIKGLSGEHRFETYLSLSCQNCPDVVQALNLISVVNPAISHVAIDGALFQDEADERGVLAVPMVFNNGQLFGQGRMTLEEIVGMLDSGASDREAERLARLGPFDVLVVGGGPAGAAAAIYTARKGIRTGLLAERFGGQVLDTMGIENLVSVPYTEGPKLASALQQHVQQYDIELMNTQRAVRLIPAQSGPGSDDLAGVELDTGVTLRARTVILATGARWRQMNVPGEFEYRNKGVTFCPHCDGPLFKGKRVAVIGGGNSGVEAAIDLAGVVAHVTVVEFLDELRADAVLQRKLHSLSNVDVVTGAVTSEVIGDGQRVSGLRYVQRESGQPHQVDLEGVFVQIGLLPNTEWLREAVELSDRGEVVIDDRGHTSAAGIFAAGDCTTTPFKQIVVAMGAGSTAALTAFDHLIRTSAPAESSTADAVGANV
ncbi:MAG TPA: alkyl hydroperoxide reductase subunit F [Dermatophilaceae bacterium]|nr:alkyl hydroperoxide reductase subunit F [Dermatophilaceae bacterium]